MDRRLIGVLIVAVAAGVGWLWLKTGAEDFGPSAEGVEFGRRRNRRAACGSHRAGGAVGEGAIG